MDESVDTTKRKPRRFRGTPAYSFTNRTSLIVLSIGSVLAGIIAFTDAHKKFRNVITNTLTTQLEEQTNRRRNFKFIEQRTGDQIRESIAKERDLRYEDSSP